MRVAEGYKSRFISLQHFAAPVPRSPLSRVLASDDTVLVSVVIRGVLSDEPLMMVTTDHG